MKIIQYRGPFFQGDKITVPSSNDYQVVQIGFYNADVWPLTEYREKADDGFSFSPSKTVAKATAPDVSITYDNQTDATQNYRISDTGILEFSGLKLNKDIVIEFKKPFGVDASVTIAYDEIEDEQEVR